MICYTYVLSWTLNHAHSLASVVLCWWCMMSWENDRHVCVCSEQIEPRNSAFESYKKPSLQSANQSDLGRSADQSPRYFLWHQLIYWFHRTACSCFLLCIRCDADQLYCVRLLMNDELALCPITEQLAGYIDSAVGCYLISYWVISFLFSETGTVTLLNHGHFSRFIWVSRCSPLCTLLVSTIQMPFLLLRQHCQRTEGSLCFTCRMH